MPLTDLLMERFKVKTRPVVNPKAVTSALITPQLILSNNPNRLAWVIINLGANDAYIHFENDVSAINGIKLDKAGGHATMVWDEDFDATAWSMWIVAPDGDSAVYCYEIVER